MVSGANSVISRPTAPARRGYRPARTNLLAAPRARNAKARCAGCRRRRPSAHRRAAGQPPSDEAVAAGDEYSLTHCSGSWISTGFPRLRSVGVLAEIVGAIRSRYEGYSPRSTSVSTIPSTRTMFSRSRWTASATVARGVSFQLATSRDMSAKRPRKMLSATAAPAACR